MNIKPEKPVVIDFHTHTFPDRVSAKIVRSLADISRTRPFTDGSAPALAASMQRAGITYSVNLPVMTRPDQVEKINSSLIERQKSLAASGIITFGGMHPDDPDYLRELRRLKAHGIPGVKLHPAYQGVDLNDLRMMRIISAASELGLIVLIHAGIDIGICDHNYASVPHVLKVLREVQPETFVLAHMGGWGCWTDVARDLAGAPVWFDTAFSLGPITPDPGQTQRPYLEENLSDEEFVHLARRHGTGRILFATDSPWEDQADYVARIHRTSLTPAEKEQILAGNAAKLLKL